MKLIVQPCRMTTPTSGLANATYQLQPPYWLGRTQPDGVVRRGNGRKPLDEMKCGRQNGCRMSNHFRFNAFPLLGFPPVQPLRVTTNVFDHLTSFIGQKLTSTLKQPYNHSLNSTIILYLIIRVDYLIQALYHYTNFIIPKA